MSAVRERDDVRPIGIANEEVHFSVCRAPHEDYLVLQGQGGNLTRLRRVWRIACKGSEYQEQVTKRLHSITGIPTFSRNHQQIHSVESYSIDAREAYFNDAKSLAEFAERTFRDTFADTNKAEDMDQFCQKAYSERIQASEISDQNAITLLSESGAVMIGFAQLRWDGAPDCVEGDTPGEIRRLYVDTGWHGKGIARDSMNACLEEMLSRRSGIVWLGVWERI